MRISADLIYLLFNPKAFYSLSLASHPFVAYLFRIILENNEKGKYCHFTLHLLCIYLFLQSIWSLLHTPLPNIGLLPHTDTPTIAHPQEICPTSTHFLIISFQFIFVHLSLISNLFSSASLGLLHHILPPVLLLHPKELFLPLLPLPLPFQHLGHAGIIPLHLLLAFRQPPPPCLLVCACLAFQGGLLLLTFEGKASKEFVSGRMARLGTAGEVIGDERGTFIGGNDGSHRQKQGVLVCVALFVCVPVCGRVGGERRGMSECGARSNRRGALPVAVTGPGGWEHASLA